MTEAESQQLRVENAALRHLVQEQAHLIEQLRERVGALEGRVAKDSHNSSKPPSSDGLGKKTASLRTKSGKKAGGQVGHRGTTLALVSTPDEVVVLHPAACPHCQTALTTVTATGRERRQVVDVPPITPQVTEYQAEQVRCPTCHFVVTGTFPPVVTGPVQYGPQVQALAIYLLYRQFLPYQRTAEILREVYHCAVAVGTLERWVQQAAAGLREPEAQIMQALQTSAVMGNDETGMRVAGHLHWQHVSRTDQYTHYAQHAKRGKAATDAIGILPAFQGVSVHDGLKSYPQYQDCEHALCNAHHLRELTYFAEVQQQAWAAAIKAHLLACYQQVEQARQRGATRLPLAQATALMAQYDMLLAQGVAAQPPPPPAAHPGRHAQSPARNLLDRLQNRAALRFLTDFRVPFTNNGAEQDLRMEKVHAKVSGTFRSEAFAQSYCRIRSYLATLHKQGVHALHALHRLFAGSPLSPIPAV